MHLYFVLSVREALKNLRRLPINMNFHVGFFRVKENKAKLFDYNFLLILLTSQLTFIINIFEVLSLESSLDHLFCPKEQKTPFHGRMVSSGVDILLVENDVAQHNAKGIETGFAKREIELGQEHSNNRQTKTKYDYCFLKTRHYW